MKNSAHVCLSMPMVCLCAVVCLLRGQTQEPSKPKQFMYVLHLGPRLHSDSNWTKEDNTVLGRHLSRFKEARKSGQLIQAGRTQEPGDRAFGIAIFEAPDEAAARAFMQSDPAVASGLTKAELHPFNVVLQRKNP